MSDVEFSAQEMSDIAKIIFAMESLTNGLSFYMPVFPMKIEVSPLHSQSDDPEIVGEIVYDSNGMLVFRPITNEPNIIEELQSGDGEIIAVKVNDGKKIVRYPDGVIRYECGKEEAAPTTPFWPDVQC